MNASFEQFADVRDVLDFLLSVADPNGENHRELSKLKKKVEENVMLGPRSRRYIQTCVEQLVDRIECRRMRAYDGLCMKLKGKGTCTFVNRWKECMAYEPATPTAEPLKEGINE